MEMEEWCSHCIMFIEPTIYVSAKSFFSTCSFCGKILDDGMGHPPPPPFHMILPNKRKNKNSRRMKRVGQPKHYVKAKKGDLSTNDQKRESDSVSVDASSKEKKQPINSDTVQTSDNH